MHVPIIALPRLEAANRHPFAVRLLALWLISSALYASQSRYARVGDFEGSVEVQIHPADGWQPALRNLPLAESARMRTSAGARAEIELDHGATVRLGPDSLAELSDYARLSTGQRITLVSLDRGMAYFTGAAEEHDSLVVVVPGAQVTFHRSARVRLEARDEGSHVAVLEGTVRFATPTAELDLKEGQTARVDLLHPNRFFLFDEIAPVDTDRWSAERDKVTASASPAPQLPDLHYGLADLTTGGTWLELGGFGAVWKPKVPEGWAPFRNGKWVWYDNLGYTWISSDSWGWLPYHYGRWMQNEAAGWFWAPGKSRTFLPGEVYWLRSGDLAGWGALAPGEEWSPPAIPQLYLHLNSTFAKFVPGSREVDPVAAPAQLSEPLASAHFAAVLPSPAFPAARLAAVQPVLRSAKTAVVPYLSGVSYEDPHEAPTAPVRREAPPVPVKVASSEMPAPSSAQALPQGGALVMAPAPALFVEEADLPAQTFYPAPTYTGIIVVIDPPEHHHDRQPGKRRNP